jgi:hypothetical protein
MEETVLVPPLLSVLDPEEDEVSARTVGSHATSTRLASDKNFISHNFAHSPCPTSANKLF